MAYRRKAGVTRASTFKEEIYHQTNTSPSEDDDHDDRNQNHNLDENDKFRSKKENDMLAARATRASAAHRDSSAYGYAYATPTTATSAATARRQSDHYRSLSFPKGSNYESTSMTDSNDPKYGFWGVLARKAKSILEEDNNQFESSTKIKSQVNDATTADQMYQSRQSSESGANVDNARLRKHLDSITSSLNNFGDTLGNAFEEGRTIMEHKTADIIQETRSRTADFIQETRKLQLRRRGGTSDTSSDQPTVVQNTSWQRPVVQPVQTNAQEYQETQLKASRDVAMATAAKAKVLLRELKTVKADLAFAKERCAQLEEENKRLRENREKGDNPDDEDLIRLQLETLLAEKARLAHENSIYARENRFLREIVDYHQLTMQDIVYLDERAEEVTEVYPYCIDDGKVLSNTPSSPTSTSYLPEDSSCILPPEKEHSEEVPKDVSNIASPTISPNSYPPEKTESSEVPVSMTDEETEAYCYKEPQVAADEAPKRPVSSS